MAKLSSSASLIHQSLADIVTTNPRAAAVFDRLGPDYCCHGHDTLEEAACPRDIPLADLLAELEALGPGDSQDVIACDVTQLDTLTRDIVTRHHAYVREVTPVISGWLLQLVLNAWGWDRRRFSRRIASPPATGSPLRQHCNMVGWRSHAMFMNGRLTVNDANRPAYSSLMTDHAFSCGFLLPPRLR
jgi:hypothetical protein